MYSISELFPPRFAKHCHDTILIPFSKKLQSLATLICVATILIDIIKLNNPTNILFRITMAKLDLVLTSLRREAEKTPGTKHFQISFKRLATQTAKLNDWEKNEILILAAGLLLTSPNQPTLTTPAEDNTLAPAISESPYLAKLLAEKAPDYLSKMKDEFRDNQNIMLKAIQNNPNAYLLASQRLQTTKEYALQAAQVCPQTLQHMHIDFQTDWDIFLAALDTANDLNVLEYLLPRSKIVTQIKLTLKRESKPLTAEDIFYNYYYMHSSQKFSMSLG